MCMSKPNIPDPPPPPVIQPDTEKKIELNADRKKSATLKSGRAGTRGMQIALGGQKSKASGLRIP